MTKALTKAIATLKCVDGNTYVSEVTTFNSAFTIQLPIGVNWKTCAPLAMMLSTMTIHLVVSPLSPE